MTDGICVVGLFREKALAAAVAKHGRGLVIDREGCLAGRQSTFRVTLKRVKQHV
jgi:hypothetical protein